MWQSPPRLRGESLPQFLSAPILPRLPLSVECVQATLTLNSRQYQAGTLCAKDNPLFPTSVPVPPRVQVGEAAGVTSGPRFCKMGSESPGFPSGALPQKLVI